MSTPTPENTISLVPAPITTGSVPPGIVDANFAAAIQKAKAGGAETQRYFDAGNQTAEFWNWLTDVVNRGENPWADGVDPDGNPILMASSGNLDVRMGAFYREPADGSEGYAAPAPGEDPPTVGLATIQMHNTTTATSTNLSFGLTLVGILPTAFLTKALFRDLLKPLYSNMKTLVNKLAVQFRTSAEVPVPVIDPEAVAEEPIAETDEVVEEIGGELAAEGVEYLALDWAAVSFEVAGIGILVAIPIVVGYLGHNMISNVTVQNMTDTDFTWSLTQQHGDPSVLPDPDEKNIIPKMDYNVDSWGDTTTVKVSYEANMQFINSSDYGAIGWELGLTPADGSPSLTALTYVPWAGENIIWTGPSNGSADDMWKQHTASSNGQLSVTGSAGKYQATIAISALRGETDGAYTYGTIVVIEPAQS